MTVVLTTAGTTHLGERPAGPFTNDFDGLFLTNSNLSPSTTDTVADIIDAGGGNELVGPVRQVDSGYPVLGDTDARNGGAASDVWTWKFTLPAGTPFVASNVAVTNYSGGVPVGTDNVLVSGRQTIAQRYDERLVVWVNAKAAATPTVFTAVEQALENRVTRVVGFVARTKALAGYPQGSQVDTDTVKTSPTPGQQVWTASYQMGVDGGALSPDQVESLTVTRNEFDAETKRYVPKFTETLDCYNHVYAVPRLNDQRWTEQGGYNVAHAWTPPLGTTEGTFRLTYEMKLCDDDVRRWWNIVQVRRGRS